MTTLTLCRFAESGVLCKHDVNIEDSAYLAISHIWAEAQWRSDVPNIPWEVLASPHKADFLGTKLKTLVGNEYFWMDILCVDQRSEDARIGVVRHIPSIYRRAKKTIVIREGGGFRNCCAQAITADSATWTDGGKLNFQRHMTDAHRYEPLVEPWFDRLWVLQEAILSDVIQFTVCKHPTLKRIVPMDDVWGFATRCKKLRDHLQATAFAWITYGTSSAGEDWEFDEFVSAFLHLGTVTRRAVSVDRHRKRPPHAEIQVHGNSTRETSKPRDFILATLPQYGWYIPPPDVKTMDFGALWLDCCAQAERAGSGYDFYPRITKGMVGEASSGDDSRRPTGNIPEPQCLGDFVKLFGTEKKDNGVYSWGLKVNDVDLDYVELDNIPLTLDTIRDSMEFLHEPWFFGVRGDLIKYGSYPRALPDLAQLHHVSSENEVWDDDEIIELDEEVEALKALSAMWLGIFEENAAMHGDWNYYQQWLKLRCSESYAETLVRIAALVSCGLSASALAWSRNLLTPVVATVKGHRMLALLSNSFLESLAALEEEQSPESQVEDSEDGCNEGHESRTNDMTRTSDVTSAGSEQLLTDPFERSKEDTDTKEYDEERLEGEGEEIGKMDKGKEQNGYMDKEEEENGKIDKEEEEDPPDESLCFCAQRGSDAIAQNLVLVAQQTEEVVGTIPAFVDWTRSSEEFADRYMDLCMNGQRQLLVDLFRKMNMVLLNFE